MRSGTKRRIGAVITGWGLVAALSIPPATGAVPAVGSPTRGGDELRHALDAVVGAGATAVLARVDGDGAHRALAAGIADHADNTPMRPDATFRIGSTTKTFIATVVLQLVGEGRIGLDTPIEHYLPGVVPGGPGITVRQVLRHQAGIHDYVYALDIGSENWYLHGRWQTWTAKDKVAAGVRQPPYFNPGTGYRYSNTDYVLAGMLIEKVTGRTYADEVTARAATARHDTHDLPRHVRHDPRTARPRVRGTRAAADRRHRVQRLPGRRVRRNPLHRPGLDPLHPRPGDGPSAPARATARDDRHDRRGRAVPIRPRSGIGSPALRKVGVGPPGGAPGFMTELWTTEDGHRSVAVSYNPLGLKPDDAQRRAVERVLAAALCGP